MLILVRGIPGSGKTTFVRNNYPDMLHLEADKFCMLNNIYVFNPAKLKDNHELCQKICDITLRNGSDCIVSNTFTTLKEMQHYISIANNNNTPYTIYSIQNQFYSVHNVPKESIEKMKNRWELIYGEIIINHAYKEKN